MDTKYDITGIILNPSKRRVQNKLIIRSIRNIINRYIGPENIKCLVLPGESCYEVMLLCSYNIGEIVCLEKDKELIPIIQNKLNKIKDKYPNTEITLINSSTTNYFHNNRNTSFNFVSLDYYGNIGSSLELDLKLLFLNNLVSERCRIMLAFYGTREPEHVSINMDIGVNRFCKDYDIELPIKDRESLIRCRYVNQFLYYNFKCSTGGHKVTAPSWYRYKTLENQNFYIGLFSYNGLLNRAKSEKFKPKANYKSVRLHDTQIGKWFIINKHNIKSLGNTNFILPKKLGSYKELKKDYIMCEVRRFYDKNHFVPDRSELAVSIGLSPLAFRKGYNDKYSQSYRELVRETGLVPPDNATWEELLREGKRIYDRCGFLSPSHMKYARIYKKIRCFNAPRDKNRKIIESHGNMLKYSKDIKEIYNIKIIHKYVKDDGSDSYRLYREQRKSSNRDFIGINNPFYGKKHTDEFKLNMSIYRELLHISMI